MEKYAPSLGKRIRCYGRSSLAAGIVGAIAAVYTTGCITDDSVIIRPPKISVETSYRGEAETPAGRAKALRGTEDSTNQVKQASGTNLETQVASAAVAPTAKYPLFLASLSALDLIIQVSKLLSLICQFK